MKYQECNKIVKQKAFERAIASDETKKSVVDSLDIENMSRFLHLKLCIFLHSFFCRLRENMWQDLFIYNIIIQHAHPLQQLRMTMQAQNLKMV